MKKFFVVCAVATYFLFLPCFSFLSMNLAGRLVVRLIVILSVMEVSRLAYQGATFVDPENRGCVLIDGLGASVPINAGGIAAQVVATYFQEVSGAITDAGRAIIDIGQRIKNEKTFMRAGASVAAATFLTDAVRVALIGDVRAVMCRGGFAHAISFDQTPERPDEFDRLTQAGKVIKNRCVDGLPVSRIIGHTLCGGALAPQPEIYTIPLSVHDEFILIGCAGLWSVMSNQDAVNVAHRALLDGASPEQAAQAVVSAARNGEHAATRRAKRSVTVLVAQRIPTRQQAMRPASTVAKAATALIHLSPKDWLSATVVVHPLVQSLLSAQKYMGQNHNMCVPIHEIQKGFVDLFFPQQARHRVLEQYYGLNRLNQKELRTWVSDDAAVINTLLKNENFDIQLLPGGKDAYISRQF